MKRLYIAWGTLRRHLANIRLKLGVRSIRDMVRLQQTEPMMETVSMLRFSPCGRKVFMLVRDGLGNKQIAELLGMSVNGVKRNKENMLRQNGCNSILELIAKYHGTGGKEGSKNASHE